MDLHALSKVSASVIALVGGLYTGGAWIEGRYAKVPDVQAVRTAAQFTALRLEEKILTDRVAAIQSRLWRVEDHYHGQMATAPQPVIDDYRHMVTDLAEVQRQIRVVMDTYRAVGYPASDTYYQYEQPHR